MRATILSSFLVLLFSCDLSVKDIRERENLSKESKKEQMIFQENKENKVNKSKEKIDISDERKEFIEFCMRFGKALENNDTIFLERNIDNLVLFNGHLDNDPKIKLSGRDRIIEVRESYMNYGCEGIFFDEDYLNKSYKEYKESQWDYIWVCDYIFKKSKLGEWKLIETWTNTEELKKKISKNREKK